MRKILSIGLLLAAACGSQLLAAPINYKGVINAPGNQTVPETYQVSGTVVGFGENNCGLCGHGGLETLDFWKFTGAQNQLITLTGARVDQNLDLAFAIFDGELAPGTDESVRTNIRIWVHGIAGLAVLRVGDDELVHPGPYGDPQVVMILPRAGTYTVAVSAGIGSGPNPASAYGLTLEYGPVLPDGGGEDLGDVPEPSTYAMLLTGLAGIGLAAKRRRA